MAEMKQEAYQPMTFDAIKIGVTRKDQRVVQG